MPKLVIVYSGWVGGREIDRIELEAIGVHIVLPWNQETMTYDRVRMTEGVYRLFCKRWKGRYVWGLVGRKEEVYTQEEMSDIDVPF